MGVKSRGGGARVGGGPAVITLSIRPQDGLHQPTGLMFDRIIRKLSQAVITGAHLALEDFHLLSATHLHTHKQACPSHLMLDWYMGQWVDRVLRWWYSCLFSRN